MKQTLNEGVEYRNMLVSSARIHTYTHMHVHTDAYTHTDVRAYDNSQSPDIFQPNQIWTE